MAVLAASSLVRQTVETCSTPPLSTTHPPSGWATTRKVLLRPALRKACSSASRSRCRSGSRQLPPPGQRPCPPSPRICLFLLPTTPFTSLLVLGYLYPSRIKCMRTLKPCRFRRGFEKGVLITGEGPGKDATHPLWGACQKLCAGSHPEKDSGLSVSPAR